MRTRARASVRVAATIGIVLAFAGDLHATKSRLCFSEYYHLAQVLDGAMGNVTAPVSDHIARVVASRCAMEFDGTGKDAGTHPCRPTDQRVLWYCNHLPTAQPTPKTYMVGSKTLGLQLMQTQCTANLCSDNLVLRRWKLVFRFGFVIVIAAMVFCVRPLCQGAVGILTARISRQRSQRLQAARI